MRTERGQAKGSGPEGQSAPTYKIRVLLIENDDGWWTAQCLEHDIATQAKTQEKLIYEIERTLVSQITLALTRGAKPFAGIPRAPQKYWDAFKRSQNKIKPPLSGIRPRDSAPPSLRPNFRIADKAA